MNKPRRGTPNIRPSELSWAGGKPAGFPRNRPDARIAQSSATSRLSGYNLTEPIRRACKPWSAPPSATTRSSPNSAGAACVSSTRPRFLDTTTSEPLKTRKSAGWGRLRMAAQPVSALSVYQRSNLLGTLRVTTIWRSTSTSWPTAHSCSVRATRWRSRLSPTIARSG